MSAARRATRVRPTTPPEHLSGGGQRITVQRACDGCRGTLGNVTDADFSDEDDGPLLASVIAEHGCGGAR